MDADAIMFCCGWVCKRLAKAILWCDYTHCNRNYHIYTTRVSQDHVKSNMLPTGMPFQNLHHLATLQVPNVDFAIFASRDDPLSTGHREACRDAVELVLVADVSFQAARCLVVPQTDGRVVGC